MLIVPSYRQCDTEAPRLVEIERRVLSLLPRWRVVLFDRVVGDGYLRAAPPAPTRAARWDFVRDALAREFDALVVVENDLEALGRGQTSFVEAFLAAHRPVKVARGSGARLAFLPVLALRSTGADDYKDEWARVVVQDDIPF